MAIPASHPVIGWPRWTPQMAVSGGSWQAAYPASNLGTDRLSQIARSTDAALASTQWLQTSPTLVSVRLMGLCGHNAGPADRFRRRLYADVAATQLVYDTGWLEFWPEVFPFGSLLFGDPRWYKGRLSNDDKAGYVWHRQTWLDRTCFCRAVLTEVDATTNPAGFFEAGISEIAQGWQIGDGIEIGAEIDAVARSEMTEAPGGGRYYDVRLPRRTFRGQAPLVPHAEWMAYGFEARRRAGIHVPFLWLPFPDRPELELQTGFLATWASDAGAAMAYAANPFGVLPLNFDEVLV